MSVEERTPVEDDHPRVVAAIGRWWETPARDRLASLVPRLFLQHFTPWSRVVERDGELVAFLIGFRSATDPARAYIHFVGVAPAERRTGLGGRLYRDFFARAAAAGCTSVSCITGPDNRQSQAFHTALGFTVSPVVPDYDGPGEDRVTFSRALP